MTRTWPALALSVLIVLLPDRGSAQGQITVSGALNGSIQPANPILGEPQPLRRRRRWRNRYFAARPTYPPAPPGARANITLEPFTSKYYPTGNSYYPPLPVSPATPVR